MIALLIKIADKGDGPGFDRSQGNVNPSRGTVRSKTSKVKNESVKLLTQNAATSLAGAKLGTYDGKTPWELFYGRFQNFSKVLQWDDDQKMFQLCTALTGVADQVRLGLPEGSSYETILKLLKARFGTEEQAERYRNELRCRRRSHDESIQALYVDICRLMALAYPGPPSATVDIIAKDAFLDALGDEELQMRIMELNPTSLEQAVSMANRLEAF